MDILTYALAKSYTDKALLGVGTIKGAPCTVKSQTEDDEYVYVTLGWENNLGTPEETVVKIKKGADGAPGEPGPAGDPGPQGVSITKIEKIKTEGLIDTYQISFSDNTTFEYTISNGSTDYLKITNKPSIEGVELTGNKTFEDLNIASADALSATDENLQNLSDLIGDKTNLPAPTDTIVNNITSVDAKVDAIIDDNKTGLAKTFSSDKITKTFATIEEVNKRIPQYDVLPTPTEAFGGKVVQFIGTTTEYYIHNYFYECVQVEGNYKWVNVVVQNVPTKVSELTNDNNFVTETELNEKGYLTEHQDISGKVDKEEGKSLIADSEITRLSTVKNYDDSVVKEDIATIKTDYATKTYVGEQIAAADHLKREIVTEVPTVETAAENVIYMLKVESAIGADKYKEYMLIDGEVACIGDTSVDLTDYAKKSEIPTELPANGGNSDTVNNHTVETDVPTDALFTDTVYDDTEVKESIDELNSNLMDFKMLGWEVPKECPIQNEVSGNQFIQKVGRVDLGSLSNVGESYFTSTDIKNLIKKPSNNTTVANIYSYNYIAKAWSIQTQGDNSVAVEAINGAIAIALDDLSQKPTGYLYYELATYNTMTIDGNEAVEQINSNLSDLAYGDNGGYNIFKDTTWLLGRHITENGINDYSETGSAYSDYISIIEPNTYYISSSTHPKCTIFEYDANKSFIKYNGWKKDNNTPCVLSSNCAYIRISFSGASSNIQPSNAMLTKTPNLPYVPYIPSVKMLAEEVSSQNESLDDYGFDNKCTELGQGYGNFVNDDNTFVWTEQDTYFVGTKSPIDCNSGNRIKVKFDIIPDNIVVQWNDGTHSRVDGKNELVAIAPSGVTKFCVYCSKSDITPQSVGHIGIYVNNGIDILSDNQIEQKMLGWTVPKECPVQNEVNGNQFVQKVGRVDLGSLDWNLIADADSSFFLSDNLKPDSSSAWGIESTPNVYCQKYQNDAKWNDITTKIKDKRISANGKQVRCSDSTYTDATTFKNAMQGVYLYYELATPITMTIDGNEVTERINESLSVIGKCKNLLNPTFKTTTRNGVTCTANGDGTYTLNGTASDDVAFNICVINDIDTLSKLICKDSQSKNFNAFCEVYNNGEFIENKYDYGDGIEIQPFSYYYKLWIKVYAGKTVTNETIKLMLTTDLNATYYDFVPYTGDGETLTHDVAKLKNDLSNFTGDVDAKTVNGHTVESNVPADAKFTDTVYDDTSIQNKLTTHTHDNRYYTETEVNNLLNSKANSSHSHGAYELPIGSIFLSSRKVAPSYGNWEYLGTIQNLFSDLPLIQSIGEGYVYNRIS